METRNRQQVIGGHDYLMSELCAWPPTELAELVVEYQATRRTWRCADDAIAASVASLETELEITKRELVRTRAELRQERRFAKARNMRKRLRAA